MKKAIYKITNIKNNKSYIGQSINPQKRFKRHKVLCKSKPTYPLYKEMNEFGIENFKLEIIGWYEHYNEMEQYYIKKYNTKVPNGYNVQDGGENIPPHFYGEEHHNSKYNEQLVENIIKDLQSKKYTQKEIEQKYNVPQQLVTSINRGATHRKDGISYPIIKTSKYHINDRDFEQICYLLKYSTCTCSEIGRYFGYDTSAIKAINSGRNHFVATIQYPIRNFRGKHNSQSVETILAKRSTKPIDTALEM